MSSWARFSGKLVRPKVKISLPKFRLEITEQELVTMSVRIPWYMGRSYRSMFKHAIIFHMAPFHHFVKFGRFIDRQWGHYVRHMTTREQQEEKFFQSLYAKFEMKAHMFKNHYKWYYANKYAKTILKLEDEITELKKERRS